MQINEIRDVKVTVVCITYKHEEFIREALDSFLMQKTDFDYQIFVGEDKGPDGTADIVREYAKKYPDKIVAFLRDENMGAQHNLIDLCQRAKSPYIAFCEGDDYWVDDGKLQKQFDYMEAHEDTNVCYARAEIIAPDDWFLRDYFKEDQEGRLIYPECDPECPKTNKEVPSVFESKDFIWVYMAHTSTLFYRWNYDLEIPDWYYEGIIGDVSLFLMQLADKKAAMLPDVVSCYRRSDVGVYMSDNMDEHFLKTRVEWIRITTGMLDWYEENSIPGYPKQSLIERRRFEGNNYIRTLVKCNQIERMSELMDSYPQVMTELFELYSSYYSMNRNMIRVYSWEGKQLLTTNRYFMHLLAPFLKACASLHSVFRKGKYKAKNLVVSCLRFFGYWIFALIPKKKNKWVFSGFMKKNYIDNTKYLYEYIVEKHPEIEPVWVTKNQEVYQQLSAEGKPVYKMNSLKGIWNTARASVAVTDHFIMSDYSQIFGFNYRTKVLQLWHGVGFKSMGDGKRVLNTNVPGVRYSMDILKQPEDSLMVRMAKKIKFFFCAPMRELFERYFMFVCPGEERKDMIGRKWNMPEECFFSAGHPRNIPVYEKFGSVEKTNKVLYAPTYRFHYEKEREMVEHCVEAFGAIQEKMEQIDGQFVLRLHPHTWRNYDAFICKAMEGYDRIALDHSKGLYDTMLEYSYVITDYSSTALDCSLFDIPAIFMCEDYEWFIQNEAGFGVDFMKMTPGPKAFCWEDVLKELDNYVRDPKYMLKERKEILSYYFDEKANSINDSERIVEECKRRLGI